REGRLLGDDQAEALTQIAVSGRVLDVLVGPAGAGKTTAMSALRRTWEKQHGNGSVVGLAPSAVAAQVLGEDLGIATENTAKW
ncbi:AAA family ATPase, partial [Mycobacterium tuberculosis]|nr:AAA family ATPase [Mycobacterium tuberculosis]